MLDERDRRMAGTFIEVVVDPAAGADPELARKLAEVCPVDIFHAGENGLELVPQHLDECVLCELCIRAAPSGAVRIIKLYSGETLPPGS